jgi:ABC-2 type transport system ATP-binding protein
LVLLNQLNIIKVASATPGFDVWGDATTNLEYDVSYSNVYVNSSLWSGTAPYFLYYPTYRNTGTSGYASEFTWDGAYNVAGYYVRVAAKSNKQIVYTGGQPISFNRSGMWIFDSDTNHTTYEGYIWVNTSTAYTIQSIPDPYYGGSITVTVTTGSDSGCMIAVVNPDNATVYHKWRAGGVSEAIKIDAVNFSIAGEYRVLAYRDFDAQNNIYYYNDEGGRFYNKTYGSDLVGVTGYNYNAIGPWDPPEKNATEITFTTKVNNPPVFGTSSPTNGSTGNQLNLSWSIPINDPEGNAFSWIIQCNNGQGRTGIGASDGTKSLALSGLAYSTAYTVWVNATDPTPIGSGKWTNSSYWFITKASGGGGSNNPLAFGTPSPANGSTGNMLSLSWSIPINDTEGNLFNWSINCSNGQNNYGIGETNGTKSSSLTSLAYLTTCTVWVNATDTGSGLYIRRWYQFTTQTAVVNIPPVFGVPSPTNGSTGNQLSLTWGIPISDSQADVFSWTIQCSNGQRNNGTGASDGTKSLALSDLAYSTAYTVWVNATDPTPTGSGKWTNSSYWFMTKASGGGGGSNNPLTFSTPSPANGSTGNMLSLSWNIPINDPNGDQFSWTIQCSNGQVNSGNGASNRTKSLALSGLAYSTTYKVWVNATDPTGSNQWIRRWYTFTTVANNPPNSPSKPTGPILIERGINYYYVAAALDSDGDQVRLRFDWGDGSASIWSKFVDSNTTVSFFHSWSSPSNYSIRVIAQDNNGLNSSWSTPLAVTVHDYNVSSNASTDQSNVFGLSEDMFRFIVIGIVICFCIIISVYLIWIYFFRKTKRQKPKPLSLSSGDGKSVVLVNNLSRIKGDKEILTDIKLDLKQGKLYAITGPSGSGKSRLMESIVGREKPTTGDVLILGVDIYKDKMKATRLFGFVPQKPEVNMYQTPIENMMNSAIQWSVENPEEKINKLLKTVGLQNRINVKAGDLSGGQQKRLSIAMELLKEPPILFLDEPTTGLDPEIQGNIFSIIQGLNKEGVSIVMTTHNVEEAEMADEIIIINNGKIAVQGSPNHLASCTPGRGKIILVELSEVSEKVIQCINELELVKFMWRTGRYIRIFCNNPDIMELSNAIVTCGGKIEGIKTEKTSMQDIFRFYTGKSPDE